MKQNTKKLSVLVIGGGPGGYVAAIRAAQLGADVTLVEASRLGGTCLNAGCIPAKSILHAAELSAAVREAEAAGICLQAEGINWQRIQENKQSVINRLVNGVEGLLKGNKISLINGTVEFVSRDRIMIRKHDGTEVINSWDKVIIASGSKPIIPPIPGIDENPCCVDSSGILSLQSVPESLVIIGGGVIGIEMAAAYQEFGTKVTVVEALPEILPQMDNELAAMLRKKLEQSGVRFLLDARVESINLIDGNASLQIAHKGEPVSLLAERVLSAVGRRPDTEHLHLELAGIAHEKGRILVNKHMMTNVPGIYAVGDCLGKLMLAHTASAQGEIAAENALGLKTAYDETTSPSCVYTQPEFAGVGYTEKAAKLAGISYRIGKFPLGSNGKAIIMNGGEGMIKVLAGTEYGEILGVHILGPRATDLIGECALAIGMEAVTEDLTAIIHAHPTLTEAIKEAALGVDNRAIHCMNKIV